MEVSNFKMVVTPNQSRTVQEVLFRNGYKWCDDATKVSCLEEPCLILDLEDEGGLRWVESYNFAEENIPEIAFEEFKEKYMKESLNTQVGGTHYQSFAIQPIEFIMKNSLSFPVGNIIKYVCRFDKKNGLEDLKKAKHYLEMLIENYDTKE